MSSGGSVQDRAARAILDDAGRSGRLRPGGTVVEGTAGNTGLELAALRVEVRQVPAVPYADPNHYQRVAARLADELTNAIWANQFDNTAHRDGHSAATGPEIWRDTDGRLDAFVASTGAGGTLGGVSRFLKERHDSVHVVLADPQGSALYRWINFKELNVQGPGSIKEGIGIGRVTANRQDAPIDDAVHIPDTEAVPTVYRLLR